MTSTTRITQEDAVSYAALLRRMLDSGRMTPGDIARMVGLFSSMLHEDYHGVSGPEATRRAFLMWIFLGKLSQEE